MRNTSKGKWMPGSLKSLRETHGSGYSFHCDVCERDFPTQAAYERHNQTELHLKRVSKRAERDEEGAAVEPSTSQGQQDLQDPIIPPKPTVLWKRSVGLEYDPLGEHEILPNQRSRRNIETKNYAAGSSKSWRGSQKGREDHVRCPTCFSYFHKQMMGKHLLSFFHCHKSGIAGRNLDPEKSLILENIHSIVAVSPYQCRPCNFYFTDQLQLIHHFEDNHVAVQGSSKCMNSPQSVGWKCSACDCRGITASAMLDHLKYSAEHEKMEAAIHKSIPIIISMVTLRHCKDCDKYFLLNREFLSHDKHCPKKTKKGTTSMMIDEGDSVDLKSTSKESEKLRVQKSGSAEYPCLQCSNTYANPSELQHHVKEFHKTPTYKCEPCSFTTSAPSHFSRHAKTHDENRSKPYTCDICNSAFFEKFQLNYHKKIHTGKLIKCTFPGCAFSGRSKSEIANHAVMHANVRKFKCDKCDYEASSKSHLVRHVKLLHDLETKSIKKFKCSQCNYETNLSQGLKRHERSHKDLKSFVCPYCDYSSHNIDNIRVHVVKRKVHPGVELYQCKLCALDSVSSSLPFRTNKFQEFKLHVVQKHSDNPCSTADNGIYVLAGLRKSEEYSFPSETLALFEESAPFSPTFISEHNTRGKRNSPSATNWDFLPDRKRRASKIPNNKPLSDLLLSEPEEDERPNGSVHEQEISNDDLVLPEKISFPVSPNHNGFESPNGNEDPSSEEESSSSFREPGVEGELCAFLGDLLADDDDTIVKFKLSNVAMSPMELFE